MTNTNYKIRIEGMEDLLKKLKSLESMKRVKAQVHQSAIYLQGFIKQYPGVRRGKNPLLYGKSPQAQKMRAGFFYHLNHGDISVPYIRGAAAQSQKLGQSWTVRSTNSGWGATIGTSVPYARLVQDAEKQTQYHQQTGWVTVQDVIEQHGDEVITRITDALQREVSED